MQDLLERYNSLSNYVKEGSLGLKKFVNSLPEEPSEKQIDTFRKKVIKGEEIQREKVDVWMPILQEKRDLIQSIKNHPLFSEDRFGKDFMRSFNSCKEKLDKFEWNDQDILVKGNPIKGEVEKINTVHLEKLWNAFLEANKPAGPIMVNKTSFEQFKHNAQKSLSAMIPIIQSTAGAGEKKEQLEHLFVELEQTFAQDAEALVDIGPLEKLGAQLMALNPRPVSSEKKCKGVCKGREPARNGDFCTKCSVDHWAEMFSEIKERAEEWEDQVDSVEFQTFEHGLLNEYQEAYSFFEQQNGKRGYKELKDIYDKIDKILPELESEDDDDEEEEEEDDEEELSYSSESEEKIKFPKKKRTRVTMEDVLSLIAAQDVPVAQKLLAAYKKVGDDSEEFESHFKRIKESCFDTFRVIIYLESNGFVFPSALVPEPTTFYKKEDAETRGHELLKILDNGQDIRFRVQKTEKKND